MTGMDVSVCVPTLDKISSLYDPVKIMPRSRLGSKCSVSTGVPESTSTGEDSMGMSRAFLSPRSMGEDSMGLSRVFSPRSMGEESIGLSRAFLEADPELPSVGSALHTTNECEPCSEFWSPQGCEKSSACDRCHLCPKGKRLRFAACCSSGPCCVHDRPAALKSILKAPSAPDNAAATALCEDYLSLMHLVPCFRPPPGLPPPQQALQPHQPSPGAPTPYNDMCAPCGESLPSIGSALHAAGMCKPCGWFWKASGCENAQECQHCHLCPPGEKKARKKGKTLVAEAQQHTVFSTACAVYPQAPYYPPGYFRT